LRDPRIDRLLGAIVLEQDDDFSRRFPAERWARVRIALADGRTLSSPPASARGNPENPLSDDELVDKYRALATPVLGEARTTRIEARVASIVTDASALRGLVDDLLAPPG
jgi:2-methylcitrate dehydratase PrpD